MVEPGIERLVQALGKIYSILFDRTSKIASLEDAASPLPREKKISERNPRA